MSGQVDINPEELDKIQRRAEIRRKLKADFNKLNYNPMRYAYRVALDDPAIHRMMAARMFRLQHWQPSWRSFRTWMWWQLIPTFGCAIALCKVKYDQEIKLRRGDIPYEEREYRLYQ